MTPTQTANIVDQLEAAFNKRVHDTAIRHWRDTLARIPHDTAQRACAALIRDTKFMPTLAEFRAACHANQPRTPWLADAHTSTGQRLPADEVRRRIAAMKAHLKGTPT